MKKVKKAPKFQIESLERQFGNKKQQLAAKKEAEAWCQKTYGMSIKQLLNLWTK